MLNIFKKNPKPVIVGGSGRSGTSMLMGCISHNYEFIGENIVSRDDDSNPKGFFEDAKINFLNDRILEDSGATLPGKDRKIQGTLYDFGGWINKDRPENLQIKLEYLKNVQKLIKRKSFCYKDPRFSYTFPMWSALSSDPITFLVMFRHPAKTARSIIKEPLPKSINMKLEDALDVWYNLYTYILDYEDKVDDTIFFIHYDEVFNKNIDFLETKLNIEIDYSFIEERLNRSQKEKVDDKYMDLYNKLLNKSKIT